MMLKTIINVLNFISYALLYLILGIATSVLCIILFGLKIKIDTKYLKLEIEGGIYKNRR